MQSALPTSAAGRLGYLLILLLLTSQLVYAQTGSGLSSVTGRVQNAVGGVPIQFANVTLHRAADSVAVKTEFSDAQGAFRLEQAVGGLFWFPSLRLASPVIGVRPSS
ncbi:hypothetical protein [Hymenobacter sp. HDW8]|uniref:hypothetical protein n=1 Tax=Hymenobacter sp. HDW8 TaxID=2714932 RepID=UPI001F0DFF3C|nr:hypothetical protein [Hymenobacter sp. HDW8]